MVFIQQRIHQPSRRLQLCFQAAPFWEWWQQASAAEQLEGGRGSSGPGSDGKSERTKEVYLCCLSAFWQRWVLNDLSKARPWRCCSESISGAGAKAAEHARQLAELEPSALLGSGWSVQAAPVLQGPRNLPWGSVELGGGPEPTWHGQGVGAGLLWSL